MPESEKDKNRSASELEVEVCHAFPWQPALYPLGKVIDAHDGDIRMAFAYVRKIAVKLLEPHVDRMNRSGSFLIAAPEPSTCDEALGRLAQLAPKFVYFHHGRPEVIQSEAPWRPGIMHSKVALSLGDKCATAWLGSHNLSENALGGINAEIAVRISGPRDNKVLLDIAKHLDWLRETAEEWEPREGTDGIEEDEKIEVLVLHVFKGDLFPQEGIKKDDNPKLVYSAIPDELDSTLPEDAIKTKRSVHLYVHESKKALQKEVDPLKAEQAWVGKITMDGFAKEASKNPGADAEVKGISFSVRWPDVKSPPFIEGSKGHEKSNSKLRELVIRIDRPLPREDWPIEYSVSKTKVIGSRERRDPKKTPIEVEVPKEIEEHISWKVKLFDRKNLHVKGDLSKGKVQVTGFEDKKARVWALEKKVPDGFKLFYRPKKPNPLIQRYLYFSTKQWKPPQ